MSENILERLMDISPEKRELLALFLEEDGVELQREVIVPQSREQNKFPLSYAQERLWFLDQLEPGSPRYNIPVAMQVNGRLHLSSLQKTIDAIVARHEILRTTFAIENGEPVQIIAPEMPVPVQVIDMRHATETAVSEILAEKARQSFSLEAGPLLSITILERSSEEHIILLNMHHIIADGWSMSLLIQEIGMTYTSLTRGQKQLLTPLPIQYADFATWQREWLQGDALKEQQAYWENQLADCPTLLQLPTDHPRPAIPTNHGACYNFTISQELTAQLQAVSRHENDTMFMTIMAAFQLLLHRYSGQDDICVGTPTALRNRSEIEDLIGFFVNTLVIRGKFSPESTFCQFLEHIRETTLDAQDHQDLPFEFLVEALHPDRNLSHSPLFQVMFAWQNASAGIFELPDLILKPLPTEKGVATFDLTLIMAETNGGLSGTFEYNCDLFDAETIERMAGHLTVLLTAVATDPHQTIASLPLLTSAERQKILIDWNETAVFHQLDQPIHHLIEAQVERTPTATAVFYESRSLTYAQLNQRANQLARHLQKLGIKPETVVGIYMERSLELIIGILGILKAGGAYIPFDPSYPPERLNYMLADSAAPILLTQDHLLANWGLETDHLENLNEILCLDTQWDTIAQESSDNVPSLVTSNNLAYIIYTSGSTGKPKGMMLPHRGLCNLAQEYKYMLNLDANCRILQFFSMGFDGSVGDIFSTLIAGSALFLPRRETVISPPDLHKYLQNNAITHILMTPSMLSVLDTNDLPHVRLVLAGGEQSTPEMVLRWLPGRRFVNAYGPTETTVVSVWYTCDDLAGLPSTAVAIPIGRPLANTQLFILDKNLQPVPIGIPGELHIGGEGVGRGYLKRPGLTAQKFIPNPFPESSLSPSLYKTGDLCRYLPNGNIEFMGRIDHQVKIRGFRIELGEIETVLQKHAGLETAVVVVREDEPGNKRIVAYLVPHPNETPTVHDLREFLKAKLPAYMTPSAFVFLDELPRLPNGKINRNTLPIPSGEQAELSGDYVPPRTPTEELLATIWEQVIQIPRVGIYDNFFEIGGHSLMATQLISRLRDTFQVELPLVNLFAAPTIASLAARIDAAQLEDTTLVAPPIQPLPDDVAKSLSFGQQRLWFLNQLEPNSPEYNIPDALRLNGRLDLPALQKSLNTIIKRHETLRTTFHTINGQPTLHIEPELEIDIPLIDLRPLPHQERETEAQKQIIQEAKRPFSLNAAPLLRATLYQLEDESFISLLVMHHIIADGWSMGVLIKELSTLYTATVHGKSSPLPDLPIQYSDYAHWQRHWLQGHTLESQLSYWQTQLADAPPILKLPTDRPRQAVQSSRGAHQQFTLSPQTTAALKTLSQETNTTLFMLLMAAFQILLYRYSGQDDISVGTPIANRGRSEVEGLIGFFINTLVLRTNLSDAPSFLNLLKRVRQVALDAYAHQDTPFDKVVDRVQPERDTSKTPLFQVMFALQNAPLSFEELPGLMLSSMNIETNVSNFDITLVMEETSNHLIGGFEYNTDLFDATTIDRMIEHFQVLLAGILADPEQSIAQLPILTTIDQLLLEKHWNDTQTAVPQTCIHQLFEQQAAISPKQTAVTGNNTSLTYAQLNQRANQLAHHLRDLGVQPDTLVGFAIDRSLDTIIGLLGILKAGGAYVPLDPSYPTERLSHMVKDAAITLLLTQSHIAAENHFTEWGNDVETVLCLDTQWPAIAKHSPANLNATTTPDNLAYVIYTSGSTGKPKGVQITHRSVVNHNVAVVDLFHLQPKDRVWQFATINFDTAVEEIFPTLISGATLQLREQDVPPVDEICHIVNQQQLTILDLPTAYWQAWVHELAQSGAAIPETLRLVVVGGEKAAAESLKVWREIVDETAVTWLNTYGPTETTIISTAYQPDGKIHGEIPIGRPIANTQVYVLDKYQQSVPIGVAGELHIGGAGLARGYLNQPELTAERFIQLSIQNKEVTVYRTGDLVRYLPDGNLEFLGRLDEQVKIRGFRVELSEIENRLHQHPSIQDAVVLAREDTPHHKRLVAYVVSSANQEITISDLRQFLQERLPAYCLPAAFVILDAMPMLPNGKVNRKALPAPDQNRPELADDVVKPVSEKEIILAGIWQQVLGLEEVGVHDNFFELGGDSILSIQIIARTKQAGLNITPRQFFSGSTIAELAALADTGPVIQAEQGLVVGEAPLTPIQHWFFDEDLPEAHHWNQTVLLKVERPLSPKILEQTITHLLTHHDALRMRYTHENGRWQQLNLEHVTDNGVIWVDLSDLLPQAQAEAITKQAAQFQASLNLTSGPLLRVVYFDLGSDQAGRLLLIAHHLIIDGVSWRIFLEDLGMVYEQLSQGIQVQLPPKTTSFKAWAERLASYAQTEEALAELDDWLAMGVGEKRPLPRDIPDGLNTEASAQNITITLTPSETEALMREVPAKYRTEINDILLTALAQTLGSWTGSPALLIDLESHGRADLFADVDTTRTVGWFTAVYPVLLNLHGIYNTEAQLKTIKEQLRQVSNQGIGYGVLRYLHQDKTVIERLAAQTPAEISFNYLGQFDQALPEDAPYTPAPEFPGPDHSQNGRRHYLLDINGSISNGQLHLTWTYSSNIHHQETITYLTRDYEDALRQIIIHCQTTRTIGATPSDFPLANLDQKKLDKLMAQMNKAQEQIGVIK